MIDLWTMLSDLGTAPEYTHYLQSVLCHTVLAGQTHLQFNSDGQIINQITWNEIKSKSFEPKSQIKSNHDVNQMTTVSDSVVYENNPQPPSGWCPGMLVSDSPINKGYRALIQKTRVIVLSYDIKISAVRSFVSSQSMHVTDRRTDKRRDEQTELRSARRH